jgi:hypothetical protein
MRSPSTSSALPGQRTGLARSCPNKKESLIINELARLPHHEGQLVLHAKRDDFEVEIRRQDHSYYVYAFVCRDGNPIYLRLAAGRSTAVAAHELANKAWDAGKDFDAKLG